MLSKSIPDIRILACRLFQKQLLLVQVKDFSLSLLKIYGTVNKDIVEYQQKQQRQGIRCQIFYILEPIVYFP